MTTEDEKAAWERERLTLVAAMPASEIEQVQKAVHKIEHFPWLNKAHHLTRFLQDAVRALRTIAVDPDHMACLLYTSPSPRDGLLSRMPSSA